MNLFTSQQAIPKMDPKIWQTHFCSIFLEREKRQKKRSWEWKNEKSSAAVEILNLKFDDRQEPINEEERTFIPYFRNERGETRSISFALPGETHLSILDETVLLLSCLLPSFLSFAAESRSRHRDLEPFRSRRLRFLESWLDLTKTIKFPFLPYFASSQWNRVLREREKGKRNRRRGWWPAKEKLG